jgi:hypothetical protein
LLSTKSEMLRISIVFDAAPVYPYIGVDCGSDHIEVRMDPVQARFVQLLVVEILGAILCLGGLVLLFLGTSGKIGFFVKGPGIQARLTNGTPGLVIGLIGVLLIAFSLKGSVKRETSGQPVDVGAILSDFTEKAKALQKQRGPLTNAEMKDAILGTDPSRKIVSSSVQLKQAETLGQISRDAYGRADYWPLVGAVNFDQGYYDFRTATAETQIPTGRFVEVWKVSRYYGQSKKTIIQLSGPAVAQANEELLQRAHSGASPNIPQLQDEYKARELDLEYSEARIGNLKTLRELAIKYYGDAKFWPILVWTNPDSLAGATDSSPIPQNKELYVLHFLP